MPELAESLTAEQHAALGEGDRTLYVKGENDSYSLHPAIVAERTKLTSKVGEIKSEKQKLADKAKVLDELGLDGDALKAIVEAHKKAEESKLTEQERAQRKDESVRQAHERAIAQLSEKASARETFLTNQLRSHMIDAVASLALEKAGLIDGGLEVALPHVVSQMAMLEEGEAEEAKFVTRIVGADKQPRYNGADYMTVEHLVEELKKKPGFAGLFRATGKGGSGSPANQQNRTTATRPASEMSATDKIAAGLRNRG